MLRVIVLGAAAGGGLPQWNCACTACRAAREGAQITPQTQSSIAVSADGVRWVVVNASPDIRQQFSATHVLHPIKGPRSSPLSSVLLTNADVDHVAGLLSLREGHPFTLYATDRVLRVLQGNAIFNVLDRGSVERLALRLDQVQPVFDAQGCDTGVRIEPFAIPGKVALWLEDPEAAGFGGGPEDTIGLALGTTGSRCRLFYMPGCSALPDAIKSRLARGDSLLFDGTTFTEDEMISSGAGSKTASRMGHLPISGARGAVAQWEGVSLQRKLFIHMNNTNPVLLPDSKERAFIRAAGWDTTYDGMEFCVE
ncbi:pyrroloquinoline quinone biosynthesis protein PqqB [Cupriavidus necator]|uniref:pyrroloquinoline quinone biosynthesis protein PqqB n=1 Tax=Cupriavidus necator TaxID=106590 RepID=UPI0007357BCB|nr:pyrroloquinoline quinone biosynthesis protein PqqB [Cupriavidus necator]KUE86945.1 pyrroloquinoline quinone biosynthesis protein PqqB [Cupriavidus necator]